MVDKKTEWLKAIFLKSQLRDKVNALKAELEIAECELSQQTTYEGILWEEFKLASI